MLKGLTAALDHIERDGSFRAIVMTGEGRGFCSGANLTEIPDEQASAAGVGSALETAYHPFLRRLRDLKMPLVTAVNGAAAGVGMSIALMGDIVLAGRSGYFLQAFARIGLVPDGGSTWLLPRLIGLARARELSLLAEKLPAEKALEWGLINQLHEDGALMEAALKLAARLADGPTQSLGMIRRLYWGKPAQFLRSADRSGAPGAGQSRPHEGLRGGRDGFRAEASGELHGRVRRVRTRRRSPRGCGLFPWPDRAPDRPASPPRRYWRRAPRPGSRRC